MNSNIITHKNIKAFTLIELLAVIVILAIIALIATPIILGIIHNSKDRAFRESLKNAFHAYEIYEVDNKLKDNPSANKEIEISKLLVNSNMKGTITRNENGELELKDVTDGVYCATGTKKDLSMVKGSCEDLKNTLNLKLHLIPSTNKIDVVVETILGAPKNYSYKIEKENYKKEINNKRENRATFDKLYSNTEYEITVTVTNNFGVEKILTKTVKTLEKIIELDLTPKDKYIQSGNIEITYPSASEKQINQYKWCTEEEIENNECESKDFTTVEENPISIPAQNGTLIVRVIESEESEKTLVSGQMTIENIDTVSPVVTLSTAQKTTNSITIPFNIEEDHIDKITCKYSDKENTYTSKGTVGDNVCTLNNLTKGKTYYYQICVTDLAGNGPVCKEGSEQPETIANPEVTITHTPSDAGASTTNGYSKEEVAHVTFTSTNITNPTYYIRSTASGVTNINVIATCIEEDNLPKTCSNLSTKQIEANTWYKVSGDINITYSEETEEPITIYAVTYDGKNFSTSSTGTTIKIEKTQPTLTMSVLKSISETVASNGVWSDETLKIILTKETIGASGSTLKYCVDTNNTCTPDLTATSGTAISLNNTGIFYIRYQALGGTGVNSEIGSYTAKVATISGTPTLNASWPSASQIKVTVSEIDASGDTLEYRYLLNDEEKQTWTVANNYTFSGLTEETPYSIKVETRLQNSTFPGNSKSATIYTAKSVSGQATDFESSSSCSSSTYTIAASGIYGSTILDSPSCSSTTVQTGTRPTYTTCTTSYETTSECDSTISCTVDGQTGTISISDISSVDSYSDWSEPTTSSTSSCSASDSSSCESCTSYTTCESNGYTSWSCSSSTTSSCSSSNSSSCSSCTSYTSCSVKDYTKTTKTRTNSSSYCYNSSNCGFSSSSDCKTTCINRNCTGSYTTSCRDGCTCSLKTSCGSWSTSTSTSSSCSVGSAPTSCSSGTQSYVSSCSTNYTKKTCTRSRKYTKTTYTRTKTTTNTCNYSGDIETGIAPVYATKYDATYTGIATPTQTIY